MSELDSLFVKRGVWFVLLRILPCLDVYANLSIRTNLDQGSVMGRTITIDTTTGNLVVALLAVLSTLG
jgi:hypothetical protein